METEEDDKRADSLGLEELMTALDAGPGAAPPPPPPAAPKAPETSGSAAGKRRGPGRPSKMPAAPGVLHLGIVEAPKNSDDQLEFSSDNPMAFRALFICFEKLKSNEVHVQVSDQEMTFYTEDSQKCLRVRATVHGDRANHFYCGHPFHIQFDRSAIAKAFSNIDKTYHLIKFIYRYSDPGVLEIVLSNLTIQKENHFPITVNVPPTLREDWSCLAAMEQERHTYPVAWTVSQRMFKKCHEIANQFATVMKVDLDGGSHLALRYTGSGIPKFSEEYKDSAKICLHSTIAEGDSFSVDYSTLAGKTLATSIPGEDVRIFCREGSPILFWTEVGGGLISMLTALDPIID